MNFTGKRNFAKGGESAYRHSLFYATQILTPAVDELYR